MESESCRLEDGTLKREGTLRVKKPHPIRGAVFRVGQEDVDMGLEL